MSNRKGCRRRGNGTERAIALALREVKIAFVLVAVTVAVHAAGLAVLLMAMRKGHVFRPMRHWPITRLLIYVAWWLMLLHMVEISVWGLFYLWSGSLPDLEAALYFSGVTYTTIGYGDLVLATPWRILAPIEGLMGILMGGLSASVFFTVVQRIHQSLHSEATGRTT